MSRSIFSSDVLVDARSHIQHVVSHVKPVYNVKLIDILVQNKTNTTLLYSTGGTEQLSTIKSSLQC